MEHGSVAPAPAAVPSPRVQLARVALDAALTTSGVVRGDAGPNGTCVTGDGAGTLPGVSVVAAPGGRYEVSLRLVAELVPLLELGARVAERVRAGAAGAGLADRMGELRVQWGDVLSPEEELQQAASALPGEMA
jgi:hypothetical protein